MVAMKTSDSQDAAARGVGSVRQRGAGLLRAASSRDVPLPDQMARGTDADNVTIANDRIPPKYCETRITVQGEENKKGEILPHLAARAIGAPLASVS